MVGRLVQHEEVRAGGDRHGKREAPSLASREHGDRLLVRIPAGEEETTEKGLRVGPREAGHVLHALEDGATRVELHLLLREVADLNAVAGANAFAAHELLEERRLAGAVRANERDVLSPLERERGLTEQNPVARHRHVQTIRLDHRASTPRRLEELEAEPARLAGEERDLVGGGGALLLESADVGQLRLRLFRLVLLGTEPLDEALEPDDVGLHALHLLLRVQGPRSLLAPPRVPRAGEERRAAGVELERRRRHRLEEPTVVGDEDHRCVERRELALEPLEVRDVEVVRRLVEEEQIGIAAERARQRRTRQLAAREGTERTVEVFLGEAETAHNGGRPVAPRVAAGVLEPSLRLGVAVQRRLGVVALRHHVLQAAQLVLERDEVARTGEHVLTERQLLLERRPLVVQRHPRPFRKGELAAVLLGLAGEDPEQRRLAGAVRPGERDTVAALDGERNSVEEERACELLPQVGCDDDCHGRATVDSAA